MAQTLLQLVSQACSEMGVQAPTTVISNTTLYVIQMLNLVNGVGQDLVGEHPWQKLDTEYRFTTVYYSYTGTTTSGSTSLTALSSTTGLTANPTYFAVSGTGIPSDNNIVSVNGGGSSAVMSRAATATGTVTLTFSQIRYAFPSDFDRLVDDTNWDKSTNWPIYGPETAQQWQYLKSGLISTSPLYRFRQLGGLFQVWPNLSTNDYIGFEYISNFWVAVTGAGALPTKTAFTVDTDVCLFPDRLMIEALKLRFRIAKGNAKQYYPDDDIRAGFTLRELNTAKAADAGSPKLSMAPRPSQRLMGWNSIPDSGYGA